MMKENAWIIFITILGSYSKIHSLNQTNNIDNVTLTNLTTLDSNSSSTLNVSEEMEEDFFNFTTTILPETTTIEYIVDKPRKLGLEEHCTCDLTANSCDINCCCDPDCTNDNRRAFSRCQTRALKLTDDLYCLQEDLLFYNNTEYKSIRNSDNILCIVTDNLEDSNIYPNIIKTNTIEQFEKLNHNSQSYSWYQSPPPVEEIQKSNIYGSPVWIIGKDGVSHPFALPMNFINSHCDIQQKIKYLEDSIVRCHVKTQNLSDRCNSDISFRVEPYITLLFRGTIREKEETTEEPPVTTLESTIKSNDAVTPKKTEEVTKSPAEMNQNKFVNNMTASLVKKDFEPGVLYLANFNAIPISLMKCSYVDEIGTPCDENKIVPPTYSDGFCHNVLKSIEFSILHNGTFGIQEVWTKFVLGSIQENMDTFEQVFEVNFRWVQDNETEMFPRSGRPGYIVGMPVLLGKLILNGTEEEPFGSYIEIEKDPTSWLTAPTTSVNMKCENIRIPINFRENSRSGCIVNLPFKPKETSCNDIQKKILFELLGYELLYGILEGNLKVGMFGDSNINLSEEWVSVLVQQRLMDALNDEDKEKRKKTSCKDVIVGLEMKINFAYQGSFTSPQAKIISVYIGIGLHKTLIVDCSEDLLCPINAENTEIIELSMAVEFINVGKAAERRYPDAPSFDIKLPSDFFYPFLPSKSNSIFVSQALLLLLLNPLILFQ